jgi:hypothetical protein
MRSGSTGLRLLLQIAMLPLSITAPVGANTVWHVKPGGGGTQTGLDWANAFGTIEQALTASSPTADAQGHTDEVWVAEGTFIPANLTSPLHGFAITKPLKLYGGFKGTEASVQGRGGSFFKTILDGEIGGSPGTFDNANHVVEIYNAGDVVVDGFRIQNGFAISPAPEGAGISSVATNLDLANCFVQHNSCAVSYLGSNRGGGLYFTGSTTTLCNLRLWNCEFTDNDAELGGAFYGENLLRGEVVNTHFLSNSAVFGGGAVCLQGMQSGANSRLDFTNCVFHENTVVGVPFTAGLGGALFLGDFNGGGLGANAQLVNCTLSDNACPNPPIVGGQAIYITSNSQVTISNSIVYYNNSGFSPIAGPATISYSDIEGGWTPGSGIISSIPQFANHALGRLTLTASSPCLDAADYGQLPLDDLDLDGDGNTSEVIPFDLASQVRLVDQIPLTDSGVGGHGQSTYTYLDMGAFERP